MLGLGDPEVVGRINAYWVIGGFVALLVAALATALVPARQKAAAITPVQNAKAAGRQLLRVLLLLIGIAGLLLFIGTAIH